jgi:thymidylate synthase (FAD)
MKILPLLTRIIKPSGFVKLIDISPRVIPNEFENIKCDYAVAQAARVSYSAGTKKVSDDRSLIHYLYSNEHTTPFEMVTFKFHVKAPIFVVRQWQRHRASTYNEISGRYSLMESDHWYPETLRGQSFINLQGSEGTIPKSINDSLINHWNRHIESSFRLYRHSLNLGVSRELARTILPLSTYTEFYWKVDLHNLLRFIKLRSDSHAQEEIREYSDSIKSIVNEYCPVSMEAFEKWNTNGMKLSSEEISIINGVNNPEIIKSKSGIKNFEQKINKLLK